MSAMPPAVVLASASPRRGQLLEQMGVSYRLASHAVDEQQLAGESPEIYVQRLAQEKAASVNLAGTLNEGLPVLGADTIVVCGDEVLGKPVGRSDAVRMLQMLSGRIHQVYSAVALCWQQRNLSALSVSDVEFRQLSREECEAYWQTGEPKGKAGSYAIQGLGALFVRSLQGSYSGVMGLPVFETAQLLEQIGVPTGITRRLISAPELMDSERRDHE